MKLILLTVLLAVMQTAVPIPRKATDAHTRSSENIEENSQTEKKPTTQVTPASIQKSVGTESSNQNSDEIATTNKQQSVRIPEPITVSISSGWRETLGLIFTAVLVLVGIFGVCAAIKTLNAIRVQAHEMKHQRRAMRGQLAEMKRQVAEMANQTRILENSVKATQDSANAANISAGISAKIVIPTLVVEKFELGETGAANLAAFLQYPKINIVVKNYGQTPALLTWWTIIFTCENLPPIPVYTGQPGCGIILDKMAVEPNAAFTLPEIFFPHKQKFTLKDVQSIIGREKILTVYGYICYADIFGNPLKRLKFCETALNLFDGPHPAIHWFDFQIPTYTGTEDVVIKKQTSETGNSQPEAEAKDSGTEKAN